MTEVEVKIALAEYAQTHGTDSAVKLASQFLAQTAVKSKADFSVVDPDNNAVISVKIGGA